MPRFLQNNPYYPEVERGNIGSTRELLDDVLKFFLSHPGAPGYHCCVPAYGGDILITGMR